jgi:hypothetical protein
MLCGHTAPPLMTMVVDVGGVVHGPGDGCCMLLELPHAVAVANAITATTATPAALRLLRVAAIRIPACTLRGNRTARAD